ncbi:MAG: hypothetical protein Q4F97_09285 [Bacteroidales bacterium]|nr:hypothetical protein [Bacteroidales bacterium]
MNGKWIVKSEVSENKDFIDALNDLFVKIAKHKNVLRIVLFGNPNDNNEYLNHLSIANNLLSKYFSLNAPILSYVAQKPLGGVSLAAEFHILDVNDKVSTSYLSYNNTKYIRIDGENESQLILGGIQASNIDLDVKSQSDEAFETVYAIFEKENFRINSIVRQWNYLENITGIIDNKQIYQEFNDSRSEFYSKESWEKGYPSATGIGMSNGGMVIDINAVAVLNDRVTVEPIDNRLQISAHDYSKNILVGEKNKNKTTPKFERAKCVYQINEKPENFCNGNLYISGTAAIRGEHSISKNDIKEQTIVTIENINELVNENNRLLKNRNISECSNLSYLRVYIKNEQDYYSANEILKSIFPTIDIAYVKADVCRDELLIEIEGVGNINGGLES